MPLKIFKSLKMTELRSKRVAQLERETVLSNNIIWLRLVLICVPIGRYRVHFLTVSNPALVM